MTPPKPPITRYRLEELEAALRRSHEEVLQVETEKAWRRGTLAGGLAMRAEAANAVQELAHKVDGALVRDEADLPDDMVLKCRGESAGLRRAEEAIRGLPVWVVQPERCPQCDKPRDSPLRVWLSCNGGEWRSCDHPFHALPATEPTVKTGEKAREDSSGTPENPHSCNVEGCTRDCENMTEHFATVLSEMAGAPTMATKMSAEWVAKADAARAHLVEVPEDPSMPEPADETEPIWDTDGTCIRHQIMHCDLCIVQRLEQERDALRAEVAHADDQLYTLRGEASALQTKLDNAESHLRAQDDELAELRAKLAEADVNVDRILATPGAAGVQDAKQREPWQEGQPEWRTGGSPGTHGLTLYRRNELAGLMLRAEDAKDIVGVMNLDGDRPLRVAEFVERAKRERDDLAAKLTEAGQHIVSAQSRLGQCQDRVAVLDRACLRFGVEAANYERAIAEAKEERDQACEGELQRAEERNAAETRAAEAEQKRSVSDEKLRLGEKILARGARDLAAAEALIELKDKALRKCSAQLASDYVDLKRENEAIATAQAALSTVPNEALLAFATRIAEAMLEEAARIIETDSSPRAKRWGPVFEEICRDRAKTLRWFLQEGRSAFGAFLKQVIDPVL